MPSIHENEKMKSLFYTHYLYITAAPFFVILSIFVKDFYSKCHEISNLIRTYSNANVFIINFLFLFNKISGIDCMCVTIHTSRTFLGF